MSNTLIVIIVIAVIVLIAAAIGGYFTARHLRGTIKMTLHRRGFNPGEKVEGTFVLTAKKAIEGKRLIAALIGEEVTRERYRDSNNREQTRTHTREIFRNEQVIEGEKLYPAGFNQEYSFSIDTPAAGSQDQGFMDSSLGQSLQMGMELMSGRRKELKWKVNVRLDAKGIDLSDNEDVRVNIGLD